MGRNSPPSQGSSHRERHKDRDRERERDRDRNRDRERDRDRDRVRDREKVRERVEKDRRRRGDRDGFDRRSGRSPPPPPSESNRHRSRSRSPRDRRHRSRSNSPYSRRKRSPSRSESPSTSGATTGGAVPAFLLKRPEVTDKDLEGKSEEEKEMLKLMGFTGFDSTKGKKVLGNDVSAVHIVPKRKYRQYMHRIGGFNRPLDFVG